MINAVFTQYLTIASPIIFIVMAFYVTDGIIKLMFGSIDTANDR